MTTVDDDQMLLKEERGLDLSDQPNQDDDTVLDHDEIEEARARILGLHPFHKARVHKLFPMIGCLWCDCCDSCCRKGEERALERMKELKKFEMEAEDANLEHVFTHYNVDYTGTGPKELHTQLDMIANPDDNEPLKSLGFGFDAYWRMLYSMSGMFLFLTVIFLPEIIMNQMVGGMKDIRNYGNSQYTLGNLGFAASTCVSQYLQLEHTRYLSCQVGNISDNVSYGIIPDAAQASPNGEYDVSGYNSKNNWYSYCGPNNVSTDTVPGVEFCSQLVITDTYLSKFNDCVNTSNCSINFRDLVYDEADAASIMDSDWYNWCTNGTAKFYMQYTCWESDDQITKKRYMGLGVVCIGLFGIICYSFQVFYLSHTADLDFKLWDLSTLTAADFTAELTITEGMWQELFLSMSRVEQKVPTHAAPSMVEMKGPVTALYALLENELTARLNKLPPVITDVKVRIAHISFAYDNKPLINLLLKRGAIIAKGAFKKLPALNQKIADLMEKDKDKLERPVAAFITFETQEGFERSCFYFPHPADDPIEHEDNWVNPVPEQDKTLLGEKLQMARATEPGNIIWENRFTSYSRQIGGSIFVGVVTLIMLFICLVVYTIMMQWTTVNMKKYPPSMACGDIDAMFGYNYTNGTYQFWANVDQGFTEQQQGVGIYQCYCEVEGLDVLIPGQSDFCDTYDKDLAGGYALSEALSVGITVINMIIRDISIVLIGYIGYHTQTETTAAVMSLITCATFFNTAILMLLTNANTEGTIMWWLPLRGSMTDLNINWYTDVGYAIVDTMLINSVYVYAGFVMQAGMVIVFRSYDKGCKNFWSCTQTDQTRCKTIQQYVNTYAGPVHYMHFKYATAMNTIFTTFMYGLALPVLFPIAALTFINIYVVEKLCVAYWYQKPPMYGTELNKAALGMMRWAPVVYFVFGYWIMGNKQIFNNTTPPITYSNVAEPSDHFGLPWTSDGPSVPMFFFSVIFIFMLCCSSCLTKCLKKCNLVHDVDDVEVDEALGNYFETLPNKGRKNWLATEVANTERLGIKTFGEGTFNELRTIHGKTKKMKNTLNYNILANEQYMTRFQYTPMSMRDNLEESTLSDMVTASLYGAQKASGFQTRQSIALKRPAIKSDATNMHKKRQQQNQEDDQV